MLSSGANVIIWDEMLSSGMKCYYLELMLSSGTKCYHLGLNVNMWYAMLSSGADVIIWDEMISSGANVIMLQSGANVIIWCYYVMLSSGMITPPFLIFLKTSLTRFPVQLNLIQIASNESIWGTRSKKGRLLKSQ